MARLSSPEWCNECQDSWGTISEYVTSRNSAIVEFGDDQYVSVVAVI